MKSPKSLCLYNLLGVCRTTTSSTALPEGTQLELEVLLPLDELRPLDESGKDIALKAIGHVVRADTVGVAVQFVNPQNLKPLRKLKFNDSQN